MGEPEDITAIYDILITLHHFSCIMLKLVSGLSAIFLLLSLSSSIDTLYVFAQEDPDDEMMTSDLPEMIQIGALLPSTGDLSSYGQDNNIGMQLAITDFNNYLESIGAHWSISMVVEDTQTDPIIALEKLQSLNSKGIKFVLGPISSSEIRNIKSYADSNDMVLISPASMSPALAIEDDNIFRLITDDTQTGKVLAKLFEEEGIKAVIPVYRGDSWGDGLYESTRENFESLGGVMDDGIRYSPDVTVYSAEMNLLSSLVDQYVAEYSQDEVAVLLLTFSELVHILNFADSYENLHEIAWFGSDASSHESIISKDPISSAFIEDVGLISAKFSASKNDVYAYVRDYFLDFHGSTPNVYTYPSHDSVWVLGKTILETQSADPLVVRDSLREVAATHTGAIGTVNLNKAGDLTVANYDLWSYKNSEWYLYGHYNANTEAFEYTSDSAMMDDKDMMMDDKDMMMDDKDMMMDDKDMMMDDKDMMMDDKDMMMDDKDMIDDPSMDDSETTSDGGGCLIATAAYGSELAPQVQLLREIRSDTLLVNDAGSSFMTGFNQFYYTFSPTMADLQRSNIVFGDAVRNLITPGIYTLGVIMGFADASNESVILFGVLSIVALLGIYVVGPIFTVFSARILFRKIQSKYQNNELSLVKN